jgi:multidrug transporter EmrE-like cation transporter
LISAYGCTLNLEVLSQRVLLPVSGGEGHALGVAHAIWCGVGIVLVAIAGIFLYKQVPDFPAILGMGLIIAGVIIMNVFSKTVSE